jgi:hypothetical protein
MLFPYVFFYKFIVSGLAFKYLINIFQVDFVYAIRVQFCSFTSGYPVYYTCMNTFLGSLCCPIGLYVCLCASTVCSILITVILYYILKSGNVIPLALFFLKIILIIQIFGGCIWILALFLLFPWTMPLRFYRDHIESVDCFERMVILVLRLSLHEHGISVHLSLNFFHCSVVFNV